MKKIILFTLLLIISVATFSQQTNTITPITKADYLQKSKNQKTTAWVFLGIGAACFAIAAPGNVSFDILPVLVIGGSGLIVGSIPLFFASGKNKRKAMSMSFDLRGTTELQQSGLVNHKIPSLSLKIGL